MRSSTIQRHAGLILLLATVNLLSFLVSDGSTILDLDRTNDQFMNITKRDEFNALSDEDKIFCTNLLKRACRHLDC